MELSCSDAGAYSRECLWSVCVWHDLMQHEAAAAASHLQPTLDQKEKVRRDRRYLGTVGPV